MNPSGVAEFQL